jgi:hypothetical protein
MAQRLQSRQAVACQHQLLYVLAVQDGLWVLQVSLGDL